ncbi:triose-phosphate isomerase [Euryarchaeota archaeon SM23-78]|nr:MAG: triose-phosphate isomerase [Euryarchaeota archaeon SM23-78]MBW3000981.1 triose-phosphate isomerase [Candidatus Woesearchaeota archaeon]
MHKPIIIINFKTYPSSTGINAVRLAKICEKVAFETGEDIRVAVAAPDIHPISWVVSIPVYAEHVDPYPPGRHTGSVLPETVKAAGAAGTLLNHSEHRLGNKELEESIRRASKLSLVTVVCADTPSRAEEIANMKPDFIAVEPPELIGGDISVSKAEPEIITRSVELVKHKHNISLLVGAGIKSREDVVKALELGADGVLIASGIDKAEDPEQALRDLLP